MSDDDKYTVETMDRYGGAFVKNLAYLMRIADPVNFARLRDAFPEYWTHYQQIANESRNAINAVIAGGAT